MAKNDYASNTINIDTSNFAGVLSVSDTDTQKAFDTLDDHTHSVYSSQRYMFMMGR